MIPEAAPASGRAARFSLSREQEREGPRLPVHVMYGRWWPDLQPASATIAAGYQRKIWTSPGMLTWCALGLVLQVVSNVTARGKHLWSSSDGNRTVQPIKMSKTQVENSPEHLQL